MKTIFRRAKISDVPFLAEAIIQAERSGGDRCGLAETCDISETDLHSCLCEMLEEDFPGCEFSLGSFFVAENEGVVVSALSAWIECSDGLSSANVKSNLFALYLPAHAKVALSSNGRVAQSAALPRMPGALQFEYVFTREKFRGNGIVGELMRFALETFRGDCDVAPRPGVAQIQLLAENVPARRAYEKFGFRIVASRRLVPGQKFYPGAEKLLLEKTL